MFYKINKNKFDKFFNIQNNKIIDIINKFDEIHKDIDGFYKFRTDVWKSLPNEKKKSLQSIKNMEVDIEQENKDESYYKNFVKVPCLFVKDTMNKKEFRLMLFVSYIFTRTRGKIKERKMSLSDLNEMFNSQYKSLKEFMRNNFPNYKDFFLICDYEKLSKRMVFTFNDEEYQEALLDATIRLDNDFNDIEF